MTRLPSYQEIVALHRKYAPSDDALSLVLTHCEIVQEIAEQLLVQLQTPLNADFVKAGCLLHDIGVYQLYLPGGTIDHKNYLKHGVLGYEILKAEGFDESLCRIASHHTGVGIDKSEIVAKSIPLPPADYFAESLEERLIMYADKFHSKTTPPTFVCADTYAKSIQTFGNEKVQQFRQLQHTFGIPELTKLAAKYRLEIV